MAQSEDGEGQVNDGAQPLAVIAELARYLWGAVASLLGLPEALAARVLSDRELPLARAWIRELERFVRGHIYAQALQLEAAPSHRRDARSGIQSVDALCALDSAGASRSGRQQQRVIFHVSLRSKRRKACARAGGHRRAQPPCPAAETQRLAQRLAAAEHALADPAPLARRLARRWAKNAALKARMLARAATPPPQSHTGRVARHQPGYFSGPPRHTLKRVLLYDERCELAQALAALADF